MRGAAALVTLAAALVTLAAACVPYAAQAHSGHAGPVPVNLRGNVFDNDFRIDPTTVPGMAIGEFARFANSDEFSRHTATEEHGVWGLELAPGQAQLRLFEAGTHRFRCTIHPQMRAEFAIPVQLYADRRPAPKRKRGSKRKPKTRYDVIAIWTFAEAVPDDLAFDVERRRVGTSAWTRWRTGAVRATGSFVSDRRLHWEVRARVRKRADPTAATEWSPPEDLRVP